MMGRYKKNLLFLLVLIMVLSGCGTHKKQEPIIKAEREIIDESSLKIQGKVIETSDRNVFVIPEVVNEKMYIYDVERQKFDDSLLQLFNDEFIGTEVLYDENGRQDERRMFAMSEINGSWASNYFGEFKTESLFWAYTPENAYETVGEWKELYALNNDTYGNLIVYSSGNADKPAKPWIFGDYYCVFRKNEGVFKAGAGKAVSTDDKEISVASEEDKLTISYEMAVLTAEKFIEKTGFSDFELAKGIKCYYTVQKHEGEEYFRKCWYLHFLRKIDGAFVDNDGVSLDYNGRYKDAIVNEYWRGEQINFVITDNGIAGVDIENPLMITRREDSAAKIKTPNEIIELLKIQLPAMYENNDTYKGNEEKVILDSIELSYIRIDSNILGKAELHPVYIVKGLNGSVLTILNAFDGTVMEGINKKQYFVPSSGRLMGIGDKTFMRYMINEDETVYEEGFSIISSDPIYIKQYGLQNSGATLYIYKEKSENLCQTIALEQYKKGTEPISNEIKLEPGHYYIKTVADEENVNISGSFEIQYVSGTYKHK